MHESTLAGVIGAIFAYLDITRKLYIPQRFWDKAHLAAWQFGFAALNALIAAGVFIIAKDWGPIKDLNPWLQSFIVGASFQAFLRSRFFTYGSDEDGFAVGPDGFYQMVRERFIDKLNRLARLARVEDVKRRAAAASNLEELRLDALTNVNSDGLVPAEQRPGIVEWVNDVYHDSHCSEAEKRLVLANFILSGEAGELSPPRQPRIGQF